MRNISPILAHPIHCPIAIIEIWLSDSYNCAMDIVPPPDSYSVAEAKNRLSELIERALAGEDVTITRHGKPVVMLRPVEKLPRPVTQADIDWLRARQARPSPDATRSCLR